MFTGNWPTVSEVFHVTLLQLRLVHKSKLLGIVVSYEYRTETQLIKSNCVVVSEIIKHYLLTYLLTTTPSITHANAQWGFEFSECFLLIAAITSNVFLLLQ